jgi:hypothetical protein
MKRPILTSAFFWIRMTVLLLVSVLALVVAKARHDVAPTLEKNLTTRLPVNFSDYTNTETTKLAQRVDDLYKKVGVLESESIKNRSMRDIFEHGWVVYLLLFSPLAVTILQSAERYTEDRAKR